MDTVKKADEFTNSTESCSDVEQDMNKIEYPEGIRAWSVVVGVVLMQVASFGFTNAHGVFTDYYVRDYLSNYSSSTISWIGSVQLMLVLSSGLFVGRLYDAGYFNLLVFGGAILFIFCFFMLSLTHSQQLAPVFLSQGVGFGISSGMMFLPGMSVLAQYFKRSRTLAMGVVACGSAIGGVIHPIMMNKLIHGKIGFHNGVRISAGMNGAIIIFSLFLARPRFPPSRRKLNLTRSIIEFSKDVPYVITIAGVFCLFLGLYFPLFFLQLNNIKNGVNPTLAFYTTSIMNGSSVAGRIVTTMVAQKVGVYNTAIPVTLACSVMAFCILAVKTAASAIVYAIIFGIFQGGFISLMSPIFSSLAKNDQEIGARMGVAYTFAGIAGLVGTPIAGALLGSKFHWVRAVVFTGVCVASCAPLLVIARYLLSKKKGTQRL